MKIGIICLWILGGLAILYCLAIIAIGFYMANMIMLAKRLSKEEVLKVDGAFCTHIDEMLHAWEKEEFSLPVKDAVISGEIIRNVKDLENKGVESKGVESKGVVIICHGYTSNRYADYKYAWLFYELGYSIVIFDERYFGKSSGKYCTLGMHEAEDIAALVRFVREKFGEKTRIGLHGESMGAASSVRSLLYETPDFIVADCPFANSYDLIMRVAKMWVSPLFAAPAVWFGRQIGKIRCGYDLKNVNPLDGAKNATVPICFIHGANDSFIPCEHSKRLYDEMKSEIKEIHLVKGADHAKSAETDYEGYARILTDFLKRVEEA